MNSSQNGSSVALSVTIVGSSIIPGQNGSYVTSPTPVHETPMNSSQNGSSVAPLSDNC